MTSKTNISWQRITKLAEHIKCNNAVSPHRQCILNKLATVTWYLGFIFPNICEKQHSLLVRRHIQTTIRNTYTSTPFLSSYPGYFRQPHWLWCSRIISRVTLTGMEHTSAVQITYWTSLDKPKETQTLAKIPLRINGHWTKGQYFEFLKIGTKALLNTGLCFIFKIMIHSCMMTPYTIIELGEHWLM